MVESEKKATLKDVALEAGLSVMTVSYVLNGKKLNHASEKNRQRIFAAAEKLNYRPNLHARRLVTPKNNIIGLLIDSQAPMFYKDVMFELEKLAFDRGYRLQIGMMHESLESIRHYIDDFLGSGVDSVICLSHNYPGFGAQIPALFEPFKHVVFLEEPQAPTRFPVVAADHYADYYNAVTELLKRGRRRIFSCRGLYLDRAYEEGRRGFFQAFKDSGVPAEDYFWCSTASGQWADYFKAEKELMRLLPKRPDALILSSDESVLWSLNVLLDQGFSIPKDIALFSANICRYGKATRPSLCGFDYDSAEMGQRIMEHLLNFMKLEGYFAPPSCELVPAQLFWGESC